MFLCVKTTIYLQGLSPHTISHRKTTLNHTHLFNLLGKTLQSSEVQAVIFWNREKIFQFLTENQPQTTQI